MQSIKSYSYKDLCNILIGHKVRFISDCEMFDNFNVTVKVKNIDIVKSEYIFECNTESGKKIHIGSNMKNLQFELI